MARLDEICSLNMGQSPDSSSYNETGDGIPFFQGNADFGELHPTVRVWCNAPTKIAHSGDILISVRAPIGALNIANVDCCIGRGLAALTVNEKQCSKEYLWYALTGKIEELNSKGTGSTFKAISKTVLGETEIPIPPIEKQHYIADTLNRIANLISLRKQQLTKLDELVKGRFVEMFGDPADINTQWKLSSFGEQFFITSGGTPSTSKSEFWDNGTISWIGSNMCRDCILYENDGKFITELGLDQSSAKVFGAGTVLIALVGATIGKTALLRFSTATNQNVAAIDVVANKQFTSEFVFYVVFRKN